MFNFQSIAPAFRYFCYAAGLVLPLGLAGCEQQQALPVAKKPLATTSAQPDRYYLNANVSTKETIEQLDPKTIVRMDVLKGQQAADYAHNADVKGVILVQTN